MALSGEEGKAEGKRILREQERLKNINNTIRGRAGRRKKVKRYLVVKQYVTMCVKCAFHFMLMEAELDASGISIALASNFILTGM